MIPKEIKDFKIPDNLKPDLFDEIDRRALLKKEIGRINCPVCKKRIFLFSNDICNTLFFSFCGKHKDSEGKDCAASDKLVRELIGYPKIFVDCDSCPNPTGCAACDGEYYL